MIFRGEYGISRIPNQRLGIGETLQHAPQARQHSVWRHLRRPECAGFRFQSSHAACRGGGASCNDVFVAKINSSVSGSQSLIYSTYIGGVGQDSAAAIAVDTSGNAYVTGNTWLSENTFPTTPGAFQTTATNAFTAFVTKLNAGGSKLIYSTYLNGSMSNSSGNGIAVDSLGNAYAAGNTTSADFPVTPDAFQSTYLKPVCSTDCSSAFLTKLNATGSGLVYSSFLGGTQDDVATSVAIDQAADAYIAGHTSSSDLPITGNAFQRSMHGTGDAFVTKFPLGGTFRVLQIVPSSGGNSGNFTATIVGSGFHSGVAVNLSGGGQAGSMGSTVTVGPNALYVIATFNLQGAPTGTRDVVVTNPDGTAVTLPQAFTILAGGSPNVQIQKTGTVVVPGRATSYTITVTNTGNTDSGAVPIVESVDPWFAFISSNPVPSTIRPAPKAFPAGAVGSYAAFVEWDLPNLAAGSSRSITYTVGLDPSFPLGDTVSGPACIEIGVHACEGIEIACYSTVALTCSVQPELCAACAGNAACLALLFEGLVKACDAGEAGCLAAAGSICNHYDRQTRGSADPNDLSGLPGSGNSRWVSGQQPLSYTIEFGNLPTAVVPAQQVVVTDQLDANLDPSTLSLTSISLPSVQVPIPATFYPAGGSDEVRTTADLRPSQNLLVNMDAKFDPSTRLVTWTLTSIDPATGQPPLDPMLGFLPPGAYGAVSFRVNAKAGLATGTQIRDQASIVFDANPPMNTVTWLNTIDNTNPVSHISALAATQSCPNFRVGWSGSDVGSGIQGLTIYASDSGSPFSPWLSNTTATAGTFTGVVGHAYSFYGIATDLTGNVEAAKNSGEASTTVTAAGPCGPPSLSGQMLNVVHSGTTVTANLQLTNTGFAAAQSVDINQITLRALSGPGTVTLTSPTVPAAEGTLAIGASISVPMTFNVPNTVTRFSVTEGGTIQDAAGNGYSYSIAQTVIP